MVVTAPESFSHGTSTTASTTLPRPPPPPTMKIPRFGGFDGKYTDAFGPGLNLPFNALPQLPYLRPVSPNKNDTDMIQKQMEMKSKNEMFKGGMDYFILINFIYLFIIYFTPVYFI